MRLSWKKTARTRVPAAWRPSWAAAAMAFLTAMALVAVGMTQEPGLDTRADQRRRERFTQSTGPASPEVTTTALATSSPTNAPTGFDNRTNGMDPPLGNKIIRPYSDFLSHDIGTVDGIPILPTPEFADTTNKMRTAPLWALRTRNRLMQMASPLPRRRPSIGIAARPTPCASASTR